MRMLLPLVVVFLLAAGPVGAETGLTAERKQALISFAPLAGEPIGDLDGRIVVMTFFASWCPPCRGEFATLNTLRAAYDRDKIAIIAVNHFEDFGGLSSEARLMRFLDQTSPQFSVVMGNPPEIDRLWRVDRIPTVLVYDRRGDLAFRFIHARGAEKQQVTLEELAAAVEPLL